jgi:hypothetical protein
MVERRKNAIRKRRRRALSHARSEVVSNGGEDGVGGVSGATFEIAAAEVTFGLEGPITGSIADHRRRSSRLMAPNTPRFWPEMKTRR